MKEKAFTIYDSKSEVYSRPMYAATTEAGKRLMHQAVNAKDSVYGGLYAADYTLFEIGSWDDNLGHIEMHKAQRNLGNAATFLDVPPQMEMTNGGTAGMNGGTQIERGVSSYQVLKQQNEELNNRLDEALEQIGNYQGEVSP